MYMYHTLCGPTCTIEYIFFYTDSILHIVRTRMILFCGVVICFKNHTCWLLGMMSYFPNHALFMLLLHPDSRMCAWLGGLIGGE